MITYTVREVDAHQIVVDFPDGSWAQIPIKSSYDKAKIEEIISQFAPAYEGFDSTESVPFTVGEQNTIKTASERNADREAARQAQEDEWNNQTITYQEIRRNSYPDLGDQLDALYWSRNGDTSKLTEIDAKIAQVKTDYPKDMETITRREYNALIAEASE